ASLFDRLADRALLVRRITVGADTVRAGDGRVRRYEQPDLFDAFDDPVDGPGGDAGDEAPSRDMTRERREEEMQQVLLEVRERFGGNAILTGTNLEDGATGKERHQQIGGHAA
ncbi:MAG: type VI secretion protein ImpB, partial [Bifidobacterium sp.]|nr:type VI secretion protein ImpB [Bifidobacterium sp.]